VCVGQTKAKECEIFARTSASLLPVEYLFLVFASGPTLHVPRSRRRSVHTSIPRRVGTAAAAAAAAATAEKSDSKCWGETLTA
jgi:hypothetical protein